MEREKEIQSEIEKAKSEYSPTWRISNEVFCQAASETLGVPITLLQVRRCVLKGESWGKLTVFVFNNTEGQTYYSLNEGERAYRNLPTNINEFQTELAKCSLTNS